VTSYIAKKTSFDNIAALVPNSGLEKDKIETGYATGFYMTHEDGYITFCIDMRGRVFNAVMTEYNQPLYEEEVAELFISPGGAYGRYLELEFNHLGAAFAAWIDHSATGNKVNFIEKCPAEYSVAGTGDGFCVTGRIPLAFFGESTDKSWLFNVYRIRRHIAGELSLNAYSPTGKDNFHMPECFAKLIFEGESKS
jgi:hypothetical protein